MTQYLFLRQWWLWESIHVAHLVVSTRDEYDRRRVRPSQGYRDMDGLLPSPAAAASSSGPAVQAVREEPFFPHFFFKLNGVKCWLNEISQAPNSPLYFLLSQSHASLPSSALLLYPSTNKQPDPILPLSHSKTQPFIFCLFNFVIACTYLPHIGTSDSSSGAISLQFPNFLPHLSE